MRPELPGLRVLGLRPATRALAEFRAEQPALLLNGEAHPDTNPIAVVQPHRGLRLAIHAPDYEDGQTVPEVHLLGTPSREETQEYMALARRALAPGGKLFFCVEKDLGADGWHKRLKPVEVQSKFHCKLMTLEAEQLPETGDPRALRTPPGADFVSCPGLFSWEHLDVGSSLLLSHLPPTMHGRGADFGCGPGLLTRELMKRKPHEVIAIDVDQRAVAACAANSGAKSVWLDLTSEKAPGKFDWITLNPPFHSFGKESRDLGITLLGAATAALAKRGELWLVANQDLPYEQALQALGMSFELRQRAKGFKVMVCRRSV